jgi:hypothetical protein
LFYNDHEGWRLILVSHLANIGKTPARRIQFCVEMLPFLQARREASGAFVPASDVKAKLRCVRRPMTDTIPE